MSVQHTHTPDGWTCKYCDQTFSPPSSDIDESCCSRLCAFKLKGANLLNLLRHDHTQCAQCGSVLKEIEEPTDEQLRKIDGFYSTKSVIGFQYRTPNAGTGQISLNSDYKERIVEGVICEECGNTQTYTEFPELQNRHLMEYGARIFETIQAKEAEHKTDLDRDVFFEMLHVTDDLVFALGRSAHV